MWSMYMGYTVLHQCTWLNAFLLRRSPGPVIRGVLAWLHTAAEKAPYLAGSWARLTRRELEHELWDPFGSTQCHAHTQQGNFGFMILIRFEANQVLARVLAGRVNLVENKWEAQDLGRGYLLPLSFKLSCPQGLLLWNLLLGGKPTLQLHKRL